MDAPARHRKSAAVRGEADGGGFAYKRRDLLYAWSGSSLLVLDNNGIAGGHPLSGFYFRETRYLRHLDLRLDGVRPSTCSAAAPAADRLELVYTFPEGQEGSRDRRGRSHRGVDLRLIAQVEPAHCRLRLDLVSRWDDGVEVEIAWRLGADYATLSEAETGGRAVRGAVSDEHVDHGVVFRFGRKGLPFATAVRAEGPAAWSWHQGRLTTHVALPRQQATRLELLVTAQDYREPIDAPQAELRVRVREGWKTRRARVEGAGSSLPGLVDGALRGVGSLALLEGRPDEWLAPAAGVPLYLNLWARDALTAGWQIAAFDQGEITEATLRRLGRLQGTVADDWRDERPGRIVNRVQNQPSSRLGRDPFDRYYGDFASPLMYVVAVAQRFAWSGRRGELERHLPACRRILHWARTEGDRDGDGYLEYLTASPKGSKHQGWKDSENAVVREDGSQVPPPFAACEIQGYHYAALRAMAALAVVVGELAEAQRMWSQAGELKRRFNEDFWDEREGCVGFGLDADKRLVRSVVSNAGQCLTTGIVADEHAPRLVARLFREDMWSGWGIRTLSRDHPAYHPRSYHLGSVWPVENGTILLGLRRYGFDEQALALARGLCDLHLLWNGGWIPECVGGDARGERDHPGAWVHANVPQTWNLSVLPILLQALLGMRAAASLHTLLVDPVLPEWLPEVIVRDLRVGKARLTLRFHRDRHGHSHARVLARAGKARLVRQPPKDSLHAGWWDRLGALAEGVLE